MAGEAQILEQRLLLTNYTVNILGDVPATGNVPTDGFVSLREAIRAASENVAVGDAPAGESGTVDTITFDPSLASETIALMNGQLLISDDVDITGLGATELTISGENASRIFQITGLNVSLSGLTLTNGNAGSGDGGGILSSAETLNLSDMTLTGNTATNGGGLFNAIGTVTMSGGSIQSNSAVNGGGIYLESFSFLDILGGSVSSNTASTDGGGILSIQSGLDIMGATIDSNVAGGIGGGIYHFDDVSGAIIAPGGLPLPLVSLGIASLQNTDVTNNQAATGGGIANVFDAILDVQSSTITGNSASGDGGGIFNDSDSGVTVLLSTVSNNTAGGNGGGVASSAGDLVVDSTRLAENSASGSGGGIFASSGSLDIFNSSISLNQALVQGGGVFSTNNSFAIFQDSLIDNNRSGDGGGIFSADEVMRLEHITLAANMADTDGGGIFNSGTLSLLNSTISSNSATGDGGGIFSEGGALTLETFFTSVNSTIVANNAENADAGMEIGGGGIFTVDSPFSTTTLYNTIVAGNTFAGDANDIAGKDVDPASSFNLISDPGSAAGLAEGASGNRVGDGGGNPLLLDEVVDPNLTNNGGNTLTHLPIATGRAVDAGSNALAIDPGPDGMFGTLDDQSVIFDQPGNSRFFDVPFVPDVDGGIDIGSVELIAADLITITSVTNPAFEGTGGGITVFSIELTRTGDLSTVSTADFSVVAGDVESSDFVSGVLPGGMVSFGIGESTATIFIDVLADSTVEFDESFTIMLLNPSAGTVIDVDEATLTITNDDQTFASIQEASSVESAGPLVVPITLTRPAEETLTVQFDTQDASAVAGVDYVAVSQLVTFSPGTQTAFVSIPLIDDLIAEGVDGIFLTLSDPLFAGAVDLPRFDLAVATRFASIFDDDIPAGGAVFLNVSDGVAREDAGSVQFEVTLSADPSHDVVVDFNAFQSAGDTATANIDFVAFGTQLTFTPGGPLTQFVNVAISDDTTLEAHETFSVALSNVTIQGISDPARARTVDAGGVGTILNNDQILVGGAGEPNRFTAMPPQVVVRNSASGAILQNFLAYDANFLGGVRVAAADVNGDGAADIITAPGAGGGPHIRVFDGLTGAVTQEFFAYDTNFQGGVFVAASDVTGDGRADIITGPGAGGGPHVRVFDGATSQPISNILAYDGTYRGGVSVAVGDTDGDRLGEIITGTGPGGGPHVKIFEANGSLQSEFFAFGLDFRGGVTVAAGDVNGDGFADVITGPALGGPHVRVFNGQNPSNMISEFFAFGPIGNAGINVGVTDVNGDSIAEIVVAPARNLRADVRVFNQNGQQLPQGGLFFNGHFQNGANVAGSVALPDAPTGGGTLSFVSLADEDLESLIDEFPESVFDESLLEALAD